LVEAEEEVVVTVRVLKLILLEDPEAVPEVLLT
jgi:hypothetical protein